MLKKFGFLCLIAGLLVCLNGCNTVRGFGKDLKAGGEAIESAAD